MDGAGEKVGEVEGDGQTEEENGCWRVCLLVVWRCWAILSEMRRREASLSVGLVVRVVMREEEDEEDMMGGDLSCFVW